jgi:hypothetical protein
MRALLAFAFSLALAGCYSPGVADGTYLCPDGVCPQGTVCSKCGVCIQPGEPASMGCSTCGPAWQCVVSTPCAFSDMTCVDHCLAMGGPPTPTEGMLLADVIGCVNQQCMVRCNLLSAADCRSCRNAAFHGPTSSAGPCTGGLDDPACGKCAAPYNACAAD